MEDFATGLTVAGLNHALHSAAAALQGECCSAYDLYEKNVQVLPKGDNPTKDAFLDFLNGTTSRTVNIGGREYYVTTEGYISRLNFVQTAVAPDFIPTSLVATPFRFVSSAKAFVHYAKHVKNVKYVWKTNSFKAISNGGSLAGEFKSFSAYAKGAQKLFSSNSSNVATYINKQGTIFKLNFSNGHFGVAGSNGVIQTFYKLPTSGNKAFNYFINQVKKY